MFSFVLTVVDWMNLPFPPKVSKSIPLGIVFWAEPGSNGYFINEFAQIFSFSRFYYSCLYFIQLVLRFNCFLYECRFAFDFCLLAKC